MWSYEDSRWDVLDLKLTSMWNEAKRKNDKLVAWIVREVKKLISDELYGWKKTWQDHFSEEGIREYSWAEDALTHHLDQATV